VVEAVARGAPRRCGTKVSSTRTLSGRCLRIARTPARVRESASVVVDALRSLRVARVRYLPRALILPAPQTRTVSLSACRTSLRLPTFRHLLAPLPAQPATAIRVFCLIRAPFWAVIVVGMTSGCAHRLALAASAECGPIGNASEKLDTGTSGSEANVVVVTPPLMS